MIVVSRECRHQGGRTAHLVAVEAEMSRRYLSPLLVAIAASSLALGGTASATTSSVGVLQQVSGATPFAGCTADNVAAQPGTVYPNSEVEPWVAASGD